MGEQREVVISGIGGLFPNSGSLESLGKNILANEYLIERRKGLWYHDARIDLDPVGGTMPHHKFDHNFFGMHNRLAIWVDPMTTVGYERSFEAIIDAGLHPAQLRGSNTEVYVGTLISDHEAGCLEFMDKSDGYAMVGHSQAMNSNRISYYFDFKGHSITLVPGESFGQLGIRMAAEAISSHRCDAAIVLTSTALTIPNVSAMYRDMGLLSEDFFCHAYEETAQGTHRSESCVAFLLQPADQAKRCYAKVMASGSTGIGKRLPFDVTLPNPAGIQAFLTKLYRENNLDPRRVAYVEGDGSGNRLLDALELDVLDSVLGRFRTPEDPLLVGTVKSNVGNSECSAAMVAICKCIIAMENGVIPATINHVKDNALARGLSQGNIKLVTKNTPLKMDAETLFGISTNSMSGMFGHTVLQPNPKAKRPVDSAKELPRLVVLSGRTEETVRAVIEQVKSRPFDPEYLRLVQDIFAYSIRGYEYRSYLICPAEPNESTIVQRAEMRTTWFVYSGMGSQWAGMGAALMQLPVFAETIERLHAILVPKDLDLKTILTETGPQAFDNIMKSFVGITACQVALTNVLTAIGLKPDGIIGHSVGELGCAYADGCLTEEQAVLAAWARGRASNEAKLIKGMMAAVGLGYKDIVGRLPPTVEVACHNSATSCTLSGPAEDVKAFVKQLSDEGVFARVVNVSDIAYHSRYIQPAAPFLRKYLEQVIPHPKRRSSKWVSTSVPLHLQDTPAAAFCSAEYQTNNLLSPVLFEEGLSSVPQQSALIEVAPHGLLQAILKRALPKNVHIPLTQRDNPKPVRFLLNAIGSIGLHAPDLELAKLYPEISFPVSRGTPPTASLASWDHESHEAYFGIKHDVDPVGFASMNLLNDAHSMSIGGARLLPPTELMELAWKGLCTMKGEKIENLHVSFSDIMVASNLTLPEDGSVDVVARVCKGEGLLEVEAAGMLLMTGKVRTVDPLEEAVKPPPPRTSNGEAVTLTGVEVLAELAARGITFTDKYSALKSVKIGDHEWEIQVTVGESWAAFMEALLQALEYRASEEALGLVLLRRWLRLDVDPVKLRASPGSVATVRYILETGELHADGLYAAGFCGDKTSLAATLRTKTPLSFQFVPYGNTKMQSVGEFLSLAVQLATEGVAAQANAVPSITVLELQNCSGPNILGPAVRSTLQDRMGIQAEVKTLSVGPGKALSLPEAKGGVFLTVSGPTTLGEAVRVAAHVGGLLLTRSASRLSEQQHGRAMAVVAEQRLGLGVDGDWVSLLRRPVEVPAAARVLAVAPDQPVPARIPEAGPDTPIILVWRGQPHAGVPSAVQEVRSRPYAPHVRMVFILDKSAPAFSLAEPLYANQLRLQLQVNVLRGNTWGCWRALPLTGITPAALSASSLEGVVIEAYGLNPRDRITPQGSQGWSGHLDYVGARADKGRVMGVARWLADSSRPRLDPLLHWAVPEGWSAAEAATVPYTYATVYHALLVTAALRRSESVLVHEGASAMGQAALRVAFQQGCSTVFTTVASEAQRRTVHKLFPQLEAKHILCCASGDTSFEWHIRTLTRGRGVDVVLCGLSGEQFKASLRCAAHWGRVLHYGREDMLASNKFGLHVFLSSVVVQGMSGDQLFTANDRDRRLVLDAVEKGLQSGVVQPIEGARAFSSPSVAALKDVLWDRGEQSDAHAPKVVLSVHRNGTKRHDECSPKKTYVVVGSQQHDMLQVAGALAQHGAREVVAVADPSYLSPSLLRHRQRALRRLFAANLRVEDVRVWDEAAARRVVQNASSSAPIDAVVVLVKDEADAHIPALLHAALAQTDTALVVLSESTEAVCSLSALCEARRAAGLRAACLAGPLEGAVDHLADLLSGGRPAVTILGHKPGAALSAPSAVPRGVPCGAQSLVDLGRGALSSHRIREIPTLGLRHGHAREVLPVFAVPMLGALDRQSQDALSALALRLSNPMLVVRSTPHRDLGRHAASIAEAIMGCRRHGPYNVLGWGLGTALVLEVSRRLEQAGHNAVTFLVDGDVQRVRDWALEQTDLSLLRTVFTDDKSQEVLERAERAVDPLSTVLTSLPDAQRPLARAGFECLRTVVHALASQTPNTQGPVSGRLIDVLPTNMRSAFKRNKKVTLETIPRSEAEFVLRSPWLARLVMENSGRSKETKDEELRPLLLALEA